MRSVGDNGQHGSLVTARYYRSKTPGTKPLVIVLPIWGVHTYPSNSIAKNLRSRSVGVINNLQVDGDHTLFGWTAIAKAQTEKAFHRQLAQSIDRFINTVIDIRRIVDWAEAQSDVDPDRIALVGFSMGAIVGSVAPANEPRIDAAVLVMGGADLHEALAVCDGRRMGYARKRIVERFGWTIDQFKKQIETPLARIEPARFARLIDPRRVLIIEAAEDSCLSAQGRKRFWNAMGRPERVIYLYDHQTAFLAMTVLGGNSLQRKIQGFLRKALGLGREPSAMH